MQTYDSYKNSGIDWLGAIPSHWEVKRLKYFGYIYSGLSGKKGDDFNKEFFEGAKEFVPFTTICNYSQINEERFQFVKVLESEYQNSVVENDLLFLMSSETLEDIAKSSVYLLNKQAFLNSFCKGFRIQRKNLNSVFANYLLNSLTYRKYFELCGRGFTRINIKQEYINDANITLPPISEQKAIAAFLDEKCGKIDELVSVKEQQIALLKERRQVVIHEAVTKGIQPNVELKNSGIDWIGEIPSHWEVSNCRYYLTVLTDYTANGSFGDLAKNIKYLDEENYSRVVRLTDLRETLNNKGIYITERAHKYLKKSELFGGEVLIANVGAYAGLVVQMPKLNVISTLGPNMFLTKWNNKYVFDVYLIYLLNSNQFQNYIKIIANSAAQPKLNKDNIRGLKILLPPISEQEAIVAYLEEQTGKIDQAIALKTEQIDKLKAYKQSLINEVVTGKVKVA